MYDYGKCSKSFSDPVREDQIVLLRCRLLDNLGSMNLEALTTRN